MRRMVLIIAMIGVAAGPASAGLFTTALTDAGAHQIKRLAVVSALGDKVHGQSAGSGPTVTQFANFEIRVVPDFRGSHLKRSGHSSLYPVVETGPPA